MTTTAVRTEGVPLTDGGELRLTVAEPDGAARGGIVVLQEARGVTDSIRLLVTGLAADGWLAVAPHLYRDAGAGGDLADGSEADVAEHVGSLEPRQVMDDCDTAFGWLGDVGIEADRMGVLGFDLGGTVALHVAANRTLGAAITVAGGGIESSPWSSLPALVETAPELTCPWLGIYSEASDTDAVARLRDAAASSGKATDVVVYPSTGYRFDDDPDSAAEAWQRVLNWFDAHLR